MALDNSRTKDDVECYGGIFLYLENVFFWLQCIIKLRIRCFKKLSNVLYDKYFFPSLGFFLHRNYQEFER